MKGASENVKEVTHNLQKVGALLETFPEDLGC